MIHGRRSSPVRMPRIAKIRLGVKGRSRGGKEYPKDVDHFVCTDCPEVQEVHGEDGGKKPPKRLLCIFPTNDVSLCLTERLEAWAGSKNGPTKRYCAGDGRTAMRMFNPNENRDFVGSCWNELGKWDEKDLPQPGEMFPMDCPYRDCFFYQDRRCKEVGRLNVILPMVGWGGIYQIETSSYHGLNAIEDFIAYLSGITGGRIAGAPFWLTRKPQSVSPEGKTTIKYILHAEAVKERELKAVLSKCIPPPSVSLLQLDRVPEDSHPEDLYPKAVTEATAKALPPRPESPPGEPEEPEVIGARDDDDEPPKNYPNVADLMKDGDENDEDGGGEGDDEPPRMLF